MVFSGVVVGGDVSVLIYLPSLFLFFQVIRSSLSLISLSLSPFGGGRLFSFIYTRTLVHFIFWR